MATTETIEVRKISYSWDSTLENAGLDAWRLDCFVWRDGMPIIDMHEAYRTKDEFHAAIEELVPLLESFPPQSIEPRVMTKDTCYDWK